MIALNKKLPVRALFELWTAERTPAPATIKSMRGAVTRFEEFLGRPALVADLTAELMCRLVEFYEQRYSCKTLVNLRGQVVTLWYFASCKGLLPCPYGLPEITKGGAHWQPTADDLYKFYLSIREPHHTGQRHWRFSTMYDLFSRHLGRPAGISDLTAEAFKAFREWLSGEVSAPLRGRAMNDLRWLWKRAKELGRVAEPPKAPSPWDDRVIAQIVEGKPETVRQLYLYFYEPLRLRGKSESTRKQYKVNVDHLCKYLGREALLADLSDDTLGCLMQWMTETGRSTVTANKARTHLLALWRFGARKRFVEQFPDVPPLPEPKRVPRARSRDELERLWSALATVPGDIAGVRADLWWTALHQLAWWTAERIAALLQLRWSDVDLSNGWLIVPAEFRKFAKEDKATKLPEVALTALRAIELPRRERIFPWPYCHAYLWECYGKILDGAGLASRRHKFHAIRRSAASHFKAAGGDATALLGHSSSKVTQGYLDPRIAVPPQAADLLFAPGKGGGA